MLAWLLQDEVFETAGSCRSEHWPQPSQQQRLRWPSWDVPPHPEASQDTTLRHPPEPSNPLLTAL